MCGIGGIVDWESPGESLARRAEKLSRAIQHRGPDESGIWSDEGISLIHRRLVLLDREGGEQPFHSPDGRYVISYNGEIYNYRELREELRDAWHFRSNCDTEVVLAAFAKWGADCVKKFNGMFSFFIWDRVEKSGFAARDLLGVKPFAYCWDGREFSFSSEAKGLLTLSPEFPKADREAVLEYLVAPCFSGVETSMFEGIHYLQPGHTLTLTKNGVTCQQWGDAFHQREWKTPQLDELRSEIKSAVSRSLIADVPVGVFLSGGFDSTLISSLAVEEDDTSDSMKAFSVRFEGHENFSEGCSDIVISDDTRYALQVAGEIGMPLQFTAVRDSDLPDLLAKVVSANDALPAWEQEIAQYALATDASENFRAVLVGDAADETNYGYSFLLNQSAGSSPEKLFSAFSHAPIRSHVLKDAVGYFDDKYRALTSSVGHEWDTDTTCAKAAITYLIVKRWLPRLLHNGDIHTMNHGLEARVPFSDTELIKIAQQVHPDQGFCEGIEKSFIRNAVRGLMSENVRTRPKSALPKAPSGWRIYRDLLQKGFPNQDEIFSSVLDIKVTNELIYGDFIPEESQQNLLFRLCCLALWFNHYKVGWA